MQCVAGHVSSIETYWATWGSQSGEASCQGIQTRKHNGPLGQAN
jgi:hypothetical protein